MVMPFRPPINEPTIIKKKVSTTSRNVVLRTLMVSFTPNARTKSKQRNAPVEIEAEASPEASLPTSSDASRCRRLFGLRALEPHCVFLPVSIDSKVIAGQHFAFKNLQRQRILNQSLDRATQRPCSIGWVVAFSQ